MDGSPLNGQTLSVSIKLTKQESRIRAKDKNKRKVEMADEYRLRNLYINYLHPSVDDQALRKAFQPFGRIVSVKVWIFYLLILL